MLKLTLKKKWVTQEAYGRALKVTERGRREMILARSDLGKAPRNS